jgi:catechol 2,3-dioxygenase-like lactoylglutathione lyase family enzyme
MKLIGTHHMSFIAKDIEQTHKFYTEILGFKLVHASIEDKFPDGQEARHLRVSYALGNGSTIDFVEFKDGWPEGFRHQFKYRHYAFEVEGEETFNYWLERLKQHGVQFRGPVNHDDVFHSVYFFDPNKIFMEITRHVQPLGPALQAEAERQWQLYLEKYRAELLDTATV